MGIKPFIVFLLIISFIVYFIPVTTINSNKYDEDTPLIIFHTPKMYTLNEEGVNKIISALKATRYSNREELSNAKVNLKNYDLTQDFKEEFLFADKIVKTNNIYVLTNNVKFKRDNFLEVNTNYLIYDYKNKILKNNHPFNSTYNGNFYSGTQLNIDLKDKIIKSRNSRFEINLNK